METDIESLAKRQNETQKADKDRDLSLQWQRSTHVSQVTAYELICGQAEERMRTGLPMTVR